MRTAKVLALLLVMGALCVMVALFAQLQREALLASLAVIAPLPIIVRLVQGRFDPFEPITILAVGACVLFLARPVAQLISGQMLYRGYNTEPGFDTAMVIALVGLCSLYVGYSLSWPATWARTLRPLRADWRPESATRFAICTICVGLLLFAGLIVQVGGLGVAKSLLIGRSTEQGQILAEASSYLFFGPFLAVPASLILLEAASRDRRAITLILAGLALFLVLIFTGPRGDRLWLLTLLASVAILPYLRKQRRPPTIKIVAVGLIVFLFGVTFLREFRSTDTRTSSAASVIVQTAQRPFQGASDFILADDTAMFAILSTVAIEIPDRLKFNPGVTLSSLGASPIPAEIWPTKPQSADLQVYSYLYPRDAKVTRAGYAPSLIGGFYYDFGFVGVFLGSLLVGIAARVLYAYLMANPGNASVRLAYAASLPLFLVLLRSNPTDTLPRAVYLVGPIFLCAWLCADRRPASSRADAAQSRIVTAKGRQSH